MLLVYGTGMLLVRAVSVLPLNRVQVREHQRQLLSPNA